MLNFPENKGDSKKTEESTGTSSKFLWAIQLIKALTKVWDQLDQLIMMMKRRRENGVRKTVVCTNLKQTSTNCGVVLCGV